MVYNLYFFFNRTITKARKLKAFYDKLCSDELASNERNQRILNEIKHLDSQFQLMDKKLERLGHVKVKITI